jgi:hypothetical protein
MFAGQIEIEAVASRKPLHPADRAVQRSRNYRLMNAPGVLLQQPASRRFFVFRWSIAAVWARMIRPLLVWLAVDGAIRLCHAAHLARRR